MNQEIQRQEVERRGEGSHYCAAVKAREVV